jgi:hypothetical protein
MNTKEASQEKKEIWLPISEISKRLKLPRATIYRQVSKKTIEAKRNDQGKLLISLESAQRFHKTSPSITTKEGRTLAKAFRCFDQGQTIADAIITCEITIEEAQSLFQKYLSLKPKAFAITPEISETIRSELVTVGAIHRTAKLDASLLVYGVKVLVQNLKDSEETKETKKEKKP